jgi:hypothetical protein
MDYATSRKVVSSVPDEIIRFFNWSNIFRPITTAAWYKEWNVFARSNAGIVGSNSTEGMDFCLCLFCVCVR